MGKRTLQVVDVVLKTRRGGKIFRVSAVRRAWEARGKVKIVSELERRGQEVDRRQHTRRATYRDLVLAAAVFCIRHVNILSCVTHAWWGKGKRREP